MTMKLLPWDKASMGVKTTIITSICISYTVRHKMLYSDTKVIVCSSSSVRDSIK